MRSSLDQYCINVSDLARSERFYTEALGLSVTHRIEIPGVSEVVLAGASGNRIQLARHHEQSGPIEHGNALWKLYLDTDDCEGLYARAIAAGAEAVSGPQHLAQWNVSVAFIRDPDGYLFEIVQMHAAQAS
jgi:lactoylglutathione lyase